MSRDEVYKMEIANINGNENLLLQLPIHKTDV